MLGLNDTPFAAIGYEQVHRDGDEMGVIAVRGRYIISDDGELTLASDQRIILVDEYEGNPQTTPLLKAADLVPFKPNTDITVLGAAHAPDGEPATDWLAGIRIGSFQHLVRVNGPRDWVRKNGQWEMTPSAKVDRVELDYRRTAGDRPDDRGSTKDVFANPIGVPPPAGGSKADADRLPAPTIDAPDDDWRNASEAKPPQGLGPVPPFWRLRQRFAGTYDDAWLAHRHPQLPEDFDYRFYQCAHPAMVYPGHLLGDETVELARLVPGGGPLRLTLPGVQPLARYLWIDDREVALRLNLDGLHIDLRTPPWSVELTWRAWLPVCPNFFKIDLTHHWLGEPDMAGVPRSALYGIDDERGAAA